MLVPNLPGFPSAPSPIDELEDLLSQSMAAEPFDLDTLLKESLRAKQDAEAVKASRKLLASGGVDAESRKHMEATIRSWELKREWDAAASVAMFSRQFCDVCDLCHVQFLGFYQRQTHRQTKVARWIQSTIPNAGLRTSFLPKETKYEDSIVPLCEECAGKQGFPVEDYPQFPAY